MDFDAIYNIARKTTDVPWEICLVKTGSYYSLLPKRGKKRRFEKNQTNFGKTLDKRENFVYNIKMRKIGFFVVAGRLNLQKMLYLFTKKSEIFCKQYGSKM